MTVLLKASPGLRGPGSESLTTMSAPRSNIAFNLFLILTSIVFLRPAEVITRLQGWLIYEVVMLLCIVTAFPVLLEQLRWRTVRDRPWSICVLSLLPAIILADLSHGNTWGARTAGVDFAKIL